MRVRAFALLVVVCAVALSVSGCGTAAQALQPKPKVVTKEGPVATAEAKVTGDLPADLPSGLPLWPGAAVAEGASAEDGLIDMTLTTTESFEEVVAGIGVGFERAGWNVVESLADETSTVLEVSNDEFDGVVTVTSGDDVGTSVTYVIEPVEQL